MVLFPNCKINLGLHVTGKREDGFHNIETVFLPVKFFDVLEIVKDAEQQANKDIILSQTGLIATSNIDDNICVKAYRILKKDFPKLPSVNIFLHKTIPAGAGLGGGSADGAFTIQLLNNKFNLGIEKDQLIKYALQLGSDCPFFIINKPCYAKGRGEILEELTINLSEYKLVLVNPGVHINTGWAFGQLSPALPEKSLKEISIQPFDTWKADLKNDFEEPIFKKYPEIEKIKNTLYNSGAVYASMSGSGSTVFGIFKKSGSFSFSFPENYFIKESFC